MDDESLEAMVASAGLGGVNILALFEELLAVLDAADPHLRIISLRTRGDLRPGVPAGVLLDEWHREDQAKWAGRSVEVEYECNARMHARRVVLQ
ncbi:MAG: hypothetical protein ACKPKO_05655, partial [Candidatus Fonsibacter sp.]